MRDPNRIKKILNQVEIIWGKNPDFRFGQLIYFLFDDFPSGTDIFFIEDDVLEKFLNKKLKKFKK